MSRHFIRGDAVKLAKLASLSLALQGCLTNSPKAVVTDASVTESKIAGDAVTTDKILNGTIQTVDIADSAITTAKLANGIAVTGSTSTWSGAVTMASTLGVTGTTTVGALTGSGNFTIGDSTSADAHTVAGALGITFSTTSVAGADVIGLTNAMTASPAAVSDSDYKGIRNILTGAPTAALNAGATYTGHENQLLLSPTVAQPNLVGWGSVNIARLETPFATNQLVGSFGRAHNSDSNTLTTGIGMDAEILNDTNGTITNAYAFHAKLDNQNGGTVTNYVGLYLQDPDDPNNATPTAFPGGVAFGVFSDGATTRNFFEGTVGIGTNMTAPAHQLDVAGTAGLSTGTAWTNTSDIRLKDVRGSYSHGLDQIAKLNVIRFNYKKGNPLGLQHEKEIVGFVAQDVQKVIPEAVYKRPDGYLELNVDPIHWAAINAIKELYAKWTSTNDEVKQQKLMLGQLERKLEIENVALKAENKQLKARLDKIEQALASALPKQEGKKGRKLASQ